MLQKILKQLVNFGITNKLEQAHFLAQADHESLNFRRLDENDKFTFGRAKAIWDKRIGVIQAKQDELKALDTSLAPQPWLFNQMYGTRMGNEANGVNDDDGHNFRGAGILQLTGMGMYKDFVKWLNRKDINLANARKFVMTEEGAILSAIWFWKVKKCGALALRDDVESVTRIINGGTHGLKERIALLAKYKRFLGV